MSDSTPRFSVGALVVLLEENRRQLMIVHNLEPYVSPYTVIRVTRSAHADGFLIALEDADGDTITDSYDRPKLFFEDHFEHVH